MIETVSSGSCGITDENNAVGKIAKNLQSLAQ